MPVHSTQRGRSSLRRLIIVLLFWSCVGRRYAAAKVKVVDIRRRDGERNSFGLLRLSSSAKPADAAAPQATPHRVVAYHSHIHYLRCRRCDLSWYRHCVGSTIDLVTNTTELGHGPLHTMYWATYTATLFDVFFYNILLPSTGSRFRIKFFFFFLLLFDICNIMLEEDVIGWESDVYIKWSSSWIRDLPSIFPQFHAKRVRIIYRQISNFIPSDLYGYIDR